MTTTGLRRSIGALTVLALSAPLAVAPAGAQTRARHAINPRSVHYSVALADQFLARLRYLPVKFVPAGHARKTTTPSTTTTSTTTTVAGAATSHARRATKKTSNPVALKKGHYAWRFAVLPKSFKSNWSVGTLNVIFRGALMRFQDLHNLPVNGNMDGPTWHALVSAVLHHQATRESYNVVVVNENLPQRLWLYRNGHQAMSTLVNTGIAVAPTATGTYPVYLRYQVTTMSGTLPNGQPYNDTGIPWVSYFNGGDALHGFIRASYGWPQSLGCVEMAFAPAKILWPYTPVGTLVTVE